MTGQQITIDATIDAPVERVWKAYSTPADITQWNFASDDWCCPSAEADLKVGGAYKARMEAKDGSSASTSRRSMSRSILTKH